MQVEKGNTDGRLVKTWNPTTTNAKIINNSLGKVLQKLHVGDLEDGFLSLQFKTATQQQRTSRQSIISSVVFVMQL